jgi:Flp pilus assembly protein TadD
MKKHARRKDLSMRQGLQKAIVLGLSLVMLGQLATLGGCSDRRALRVVREEGDKAYRFQRYEQAREEFAEVVERDPTDWEYRAKLGETLLILGRPVQAREQLAVAYDLRPQNAEILEDYARAMLASEDFDTLHQVLLERARETQRVEDYIRLGEYDLRAGDADSAERALITAANIDQGQTPEPQLALATFYETIGDETQAVRRLRMALYTDPENPEANERLRAKGHIPGPTFALPPVELR